MHMLLGIIPDYLSWHYSTSLVDFVRIWKNYFWFIYNIFSIPELLKTLFAPWQRMDVERTKRGFDFEDIAETIVTNLILRVMGATVRLMVVALGIGILILIIVLGICAFLIWFALPVLIVVGIVGGLIRFFG